MVKNEKVAKRSQKGDFSLFIDYKKECRFLLQALEAGTAKAIDATDDIQICKKQQTRMLREEYGLAEEIAAGMVETLALALRGEVKEKKLCKNCGKEMAEEWKACPFCGTQVVNQKTETAISSSSGKVDYGHWSISSIVQLDQNARELLESGQIYINKGDKNNAIKKFDEVIKLYPNFALAYCLRADAYAYFSENVSQGQYDMAIRDYTEAIRIEPNNSDAFRRRGEAYYHQGDIGSAINDQNEAIRLNPNDAWAYYRRGDAYRLLEQYDAAISDLSEAIRLDPNITDAYQMRGISYYDQSQYDAAISDLSEAIRVEKNHPFFYYYCGLAYQKQGQYNAAISDLNEAIRIGPDFWFYTARGETHRVLGEFDLAIRDYTETIIRDPNDAYVYGVRGMAYRQLGQKKQAIQDFERALNLNPNLEWVRQELRETQGALGFLKDLFRE